ncbi:MAG: ABC transporter permease subunit [Chloroflexi bacterium]|nr:ABC transporter permease subunit [Chloroflexota bacterium]
MMNNPVLVRELRGRMRGRRAFAVLSAFLLFLGGFAVLIYGGASLSMSAGAGTSAISAGKIVFSGLFLFELALISFLTPAFTAGAFSGERERRTYDLLVSTPLSARQIVWGKLVSALAYMVALVVASVPILGMAFMMGGVSPEEVAIGFWILLLTTVTFGSVGVFFSSFLKSTLVSTVLSYVTVLLLTVGLPILFLVTSPFLGVFGRSPLPGWISSSPVIYTVGIVLCSNPFFAAGATEVFYAGGKSLFYFTETLGSTKVFLVSPWLVFSFLYLLASLILTFLATRRIGRSR